MTQLQALARVKLVEHEILLPEVGEILVNQAPGNLS